MGASFLMLIHTHIYHHIRHTVNSRWKTRNTGEREPAPSFPPTHSFIRDLQVTSEVVLMRVEFHKQNLQLNNVPLVHHVAPCSIHPVRSLLTLVGHL